MRKKWLNDTWRKLLFCFELLNNYKLTIKVLNEPEELKQAHKLRARIFGDMLRWVKIDPRLGDIDDYDKEAVHFGVFKKGKLIAYSRMILSHKPFMIEKDFRPLVKNAIIRKEKDTTEVSRLTLSEEYIKTIKGKLIKNLLYRKMYRWSLENNVRYWYVVVGTEYFSRLKKNFGLIKVGNPYSFKGGKPAVAGLIDLKKVKKNIHNKNWFVYKWFHK